jgi:hypothetical protein
MNLRAAPHAFHNLLTQVTAFTEIHGMRLAGLLNQVPLRDLFAVARPAVLDADDACFLGVRRDGSGGSEFGQQRGFLWGWQKNEASAGAGRVGPRDNPRPPGEPAMIGFGQGSAQS